MFDIRLADTISLQVCKADPQASAGLEPVPIVPQVPICQKRESGGFHFLFPFSVTNATVLDCCSSPFRVWEVFGKCSLLVTLHLLMCALDGLPSSFSSFRDLLLSTLFPQDQLPQSQQVSAEQKRFFFDVGSNSRGVFLRISEVRLVSNLCKEWVCGAHDLFLFSRNSRHLRCLDYFVLTSPSLSSPGPGNLPHCHHHPPLCLGSVPRPFPAVWRRPRQHPGCASPPVKRERSDSV